MTRSSKLFSVRLHIAVVAEVVVHAKDRELAEAIARSLWHDQMADAHIMGFHVQHNAIHINQPQEVAS